MSVFSRRASKPTDAAASLARFADLQHLKLVLDTLNVLERRRLLEEYAFEAFHLVDELLLATDAAAGQGTAGAGALEAESGLWTLEQLLLFVPELIANGWQRHAIECAIKKAVYPANVLAVRKIAIRLFLLFYQILSTTGKSASLDVVFQCLLPFFPLSDGRSTERVLRAYCQSQGSSSSAWEASAGAAAVQHPEPPPPPHIAKERAQTLQVYLDKLLEYCTREPARIEWADERHRLDCAAFLLDRVVHLYVFECFPELEHNGVDVFGGWEGADESVTPLDTADPLVIARYWLIRWLNNMAHPEGGVGASAPDGGRTLAEQHALAGARLFRVALFADARHTNTLLSAQREAMRLPLACVNVIHKVVALLADWLLGEPAPFVASRAVSPSAATLLTVHTLLGFFHSPYLAAPGDRMQSAVSVCWAIVALLQRLFAPAERARLAVAPAVWPDLLGGMLDAAHVLCQRAHPLSTHVAAPLAATTLAALVSVEGATDTVGPGGGGNAQQDVGSSSSHLWDAAWLPFRQPVNMQVVERWAAVFDQTTSVLLRVLGADEQLVLETSYVLRKQGRVSSVSSSGGMIGGGGGGGGAVAAGARLAERRREAEQRARAETDDSCSVDACSLGGGGGGGGGGSSAESSSGPSESIHFQTATFDYADIVTPTLQASSSSDESAAAMRWTRVWRRVGAMGGVERGAGSYAALVVSALAAAAERVRRAGRTELLAWIVERLVLATQGDAAAAAVPSLARALAHRPLLDAALEDAVLGAFIRLLQSDASAPAVVAIVRALPVRHQHALSGALLALLPRATASVNTDPNEQQHSPNAIAPVQLLASDLVPIGALWAGESSRARAFLLRVVHDEMVETRDAVLALNALAIRIVSAADVELMAGVERALVARLAASQSLLERKLQQMSNGGGAMRRSRPASTSSMSAHASTASSLAVLLAGSLIPLARMGLAAQLQMLVIRLVDVVDQERLRAELLVYAVDLAMEHRQCASAPILEHLATQLRRDGHALLLALLDEMAGGGWPLAGHSADRWDAHDAGSQQPTIAIIADDVILTLSATEPTELVARTLTGRRLYRLGEPPVEVLDEDDRKDEENGGGDGYARSWLDFLPPPPAVLEATASGAASDAETEQCQVTFPHSEMRPPPQSPSLVLSSPKPFQGDAVFEIPPPAQSAPTNTNATPRAIVRLVEALEKCMSPSQTKGANAVERNGGGRLLAPAPLHHWHVLAAGLKRRPLRSNGNNMPPTLLDATALSEMARDIRHLDATPCRERHKAALIYVPPGAGDRAAVLQCKTESPAFTDFVQQLGWRVKIGAGHQGYAGGLPNDADAVYWASPTAELLWHVSTRLADDERQRVKHIGNDEVHLVWTESDTVYKRDTINTAFCDVLIVIQRQHVESPNRHGPGGGGGGGGGDAEKGGEVEDEEEEEEEEETPPLYRIRVETQRPHLDVGPLCDGVQVGETELAELARATVLNASRACRLAAGGTGNYQQQPLQQHHQHVADQMLDPTAAAAAAVPPLPPPRPVRHREAVWADVLARLRARARRLEQ